jgi:hypothetical protein
MYYGMDLSAPLPTLRRAVVKWPANFSSALPP